MGTILNAIAVIVASFIGVIFKKGLPGNLQKTIMFVMGLALTALALGWFLQYFLVIEDGTLTTRYELLVLGSLVAGTLIGEKIDIDGKLKRFAYGVEHRYNLPPLAKGFISGTLIFCVGALAILGPIQDALHGDISVLAVKSTLDFITALMLAAVFGIGVAFAAISILLYQGAIHIAALFAGMFLTTAMIEGFSMVGNVILVAMGLNFMEIKEIKVANMLPALLFPIVYHIVVGLL